MIITSTVIATQNFLRDVDLGHLVEFQCVSLDNSCHQAEGADTIVWLATLPKNGPQGGYFRDRKPIDW
jgi:hypothetical protein